MDLNNITNNRLLHIIGVARECYRLAKIEGLSEEKCQEMGLMGYMHDIGYEFTINGKSHEEISAQLLCNMGVSEEVYLAIKNHGKNTTYTFIELDILNVAELTIDSFGRKVKPESRLEDIAAEYGKESGEYQNMQLLLAKYKERKIL